MGHATVDGRALTSRLVDRALAIGADQAQASHTESEKFEVNFETTDISLLRSTVNHSASITVFKDGKKGSASFNTISDAEIDSALRQALEGAEAGVPDEANQIATGDPTPPMHHGPTSADREGMLDTVLGYLAQMRTQYPKILSDNSIYAFTAGTRTFGNSAGLTRQERRGSYGFGAMFSAKDGKRATSFNYTGVESYDPIADLLDAGTVRRLLDETMQSLDPRPVPEKFVGDVIFTPDSMSDLVGVLSGALSGYALLAGTTPFKDKQGEEIASPRFSLLNRPRHEAFPGGCDFDGFGVPTCDLDVVAGGRLNEFLIDFYISKKLQRPQTAGATNFIVPPGETSIEEIVRATKRGIILSRFSGGQPNNNLDFSGVAKNSFYVEDGEVRYALVETMVAGNMQALLKQIRAVSRETVNFGGSAYPFLAAGGVTISSD